MTSGFDSQTLAEKLSKLNNSQQSIESLSSWCISYRKKAKQVVETWEKLFNSSSKEQKVSFLYLANDILQNSRRKGSEFVNEFWKVLPGALKNVYENGEDLGKNVVLRLVGIWDERKVFGSRVRSLKSDILGKEPDPTPLLDNNGKSSNSNTIKVVRKDAQTIRLKLAVGGMPEKIVTAYQSVLDEHLNEDTALNKCKVAIHLVGKIAQDVDVAFTQGILQGHPLTSELHEHETILKQCIDQLKSVEASRASLIAYLKDGLEEQESKLEHIRTQMLAAERETDRLSNLMQRMGAAAATAIPIPCTNTTQNPSIPMTMSVESMAPTTEAVPSPQTLNGPPQLQHPQPVTSFTTTISSTDEQQKKAAAAAMAAKLAASTSSAQMLTSVLSSLVAEEAASKNGSLTSVSITSSPPMFPANKRPKLEKPMSLSDPGNAYFGHMQQQSMGSLPLSMPPVSVSSLPPLPQNNHPLPPFPPPPPPLQSFPPPPLPPGQQFMQTSGGLVGVMPYGYSGNPLHPPPLPSSMGLARPGTLPPPPPPPLPPMPRPQQQPQQQQQASQQQQSPPSGFYQSPGNGFYGQLQSAPPGQGQ